MIDSNPVAHIDRPQLENARQLPRKHFSVIPCSSPLCYRVQPRMSSIIRFCWRPFKGIVACDEKKLSHDCLKSRLCSCASITSLPSS